MVLDDSRKIKRTINCLLTAIRYYSIFFISQDRSPTTAAIQDGIRGTFKRSPVITSKPERNKTKERIKTIDEV